MQTIAVGDRDFSIELNSSLNTAKTATPHFTHLINDQIMTILLHRYFCIPPLPESDSHHLLGEFLQNILVGGPDFVPIPQQALAWCSSVA